MWGNIWLCEPIYMCIRFLFGYNFYSNIEYKYIKINWYTWSWEICDWFQTTLYTRVLLNVTKRMKKHPFFGVFSSINTLVFYYPITPSTLSKMQWVDFFPNVDVETRTTILSVFFGLVQTQKIFIYW